MSCILTRENAAVNKNLKYTAGLVVSIQKEQEQKTPHAGMAHLSYINLLCKIF
jgi:hypothetical protein